MDALKRARGCPVRDRQVGATLLEVLVTVAVTSIGLLGMGGLMLVSQRVNQEAYQRTQAGFIVQSLVESMRINPAGVIAGAYDGDSGDDSPVADCDTRGCTPAQRARYDRAIFDRSLAQTLPNANAALDCRRDDAGGEGLCRLAIDWTLRDATSASDGAAQSLVWVFRP